MILNLGLSRQIPVEIVRTDRRKTVAFSVIEEQVRIVVPKRLSEKRIQQLIQRKTPWIRRKLQIQSTIPPVRSKEYVSGESFTYMGRNYRLKVLEGSADGVKLENGQLVVRIPKNIQGKKKTDRVEKQLKHWYINHAQEKMTEKTRRYAEILGVKPDTVAVRDYKSRWGSCSVKGEIKYNWKIIIAPNHIIDYVVVHELSHMRHPNHSRDFWRYVGRVIPDYRECREWLKENGRTLFI